MATVEHCLYCFEALAAHLEKRDAMTLKQIQDSWADYPKGLEDSAEVDQDEEPSESEIEDAEEPNTAAKTDKAIHLKAKKTPSASNLLSVPRSSTTSTTPSSSSTTSLATSTSTPASSSSDSPHPFLPTAISSRRTFQRAEITESPLFVTWNKRSGSSGHSLRGCIGTFEEQTLSSGLSSYALTSALHDTRFSPVSKSELPSLSVSVTLLTDFETCVEPMDWTVGIHGIRISFYHHHKRYGATYLPDVCVEQGWTKEECMVSLMRKAGWLGKRDKWRDVGDLKVVRYQGKAESLDWEEFETWRAWVGKRKEA